jgi:hypothetical protein
MASPSLQEVRVTAWALRCIFNRSRLVERAETGEFIEKVIRDKPSPNPLHPENTRSQNVMFQNAQGDEISKAHRYLFPSGESEADPKSVRVGSVRYVVHGEPKKRNPEEWINADWISRSLTKRLRRAYGAMMKQKCRWFGPIAIVH